MLIEYDLELDGELHPILVKESEFEHEGVFHSSKEIVDIVNKCYHLNHKAEEYVLLLVVNTKTKPLGVFKVAKGTINRCLLSPREVLLRALLCGGSYFFLIHNHPSGDVKPSSEDILVLHNMKQAGELIGIEMQDYLIVGGTSYWSSHESLCN